MQTVEGKVLLVETKQPHLIVEQIRKSKVIQQVGDTYEVAVHWGLEEAQTLAKLGFNSTPSTIERDYKWTGRHKPFDHQRATASFLTLHPKSFCFNEQGLGKTASAIWAADYLMSIGKVRRVLVLCPLSIMRSAWQEDLFKFAMHRSCSVAYGDAKTRERIVNTGSEFVIINFDGLAVVKDAVIKGGFDLIIVDEASFYKNAQTKRWKVLRDVAKHASWLWMMTGTPAAQSPLDAYGLAKLIRPTDLPYFGEFRAQVMYKATQFKWLPKPDADSYVHRILQPAIRFEREQCLDLPEMTSVFREAPLTPQQLKYYKQLKNKLQMEADGEQVTAVHAAAKMNKMLQISAGAVYTDEGGVLEFDVSNRINAVREVIEEASHKVLVFVPFTHTIELLQIQLEAHGISCGVINGDVSLNKRSSLVQQFQNGSDPKVLLIQPQAASHGLTLTAANTIIWYAPITSVETYLQANARINRPGQINSMLVVHIEGSPVERRLYDMLATGIATHQKIIDLYREEIEPSY